MPPYTVPELFGLPVRLRRVILRKLLRMNSDPRQKRCVALGPKNECRIYRYRPAVCRDMPVGGEWCVSYRRRFPLEQRTIDHA